MNMRCPDCDSTLFHVKKDSHGNQHLCCYRGLECGWSVKIELPVAFTSNTLTKTKIDWAVSQRYLLHKHFHERKGDHPAKP